MLPLSTLLILLLGHWVADFIFQTDWMAKNKYKNAYPRFIHCLVYTLVFGIFSYFVVPLDILFWFVLVNGITHFIIDTYTSKASSYLSSQGKYGSDVIPNFGMFTIIGFDQFLHYLIMFSTYVFLVEY